MRVLIFQPGCRFDCSFCNPPAPKEDVNFRGKSINTIESTINETLENENYFLITGNDPIDDFDELLRILDIINSKFNQPHIRLETHGTAIDNTRIKELYSRNVKSTTVPIYSTYESEMENIMQPKKGWENKDILNEQYSYFDLCIEYGIDIHIQLALLQSNIDTVFGTIDSLCKTKEYQSVTIIPMKIHSLDTDLTEYIPIKNLYEYSAQLVNLLQTYPQKLKIRDFPFCMIGRKLSNTYNYLTLDVLNQGYVKVIGEYTPSQPTIDSSAKIPKYMTNIYDTECESCKYYNDCAGWNYQDYLLYGRGNVKSL